MRALLTMVCMGLVLATHAFTTGYANAATVTPEQEAHCISAETIKSDAVISRLFPDADGDWWIVLRYASTGTLHVGLLTRSGKFCIAGEGRTNRES
jgi:hypothetical protein